MRRLVLMAAAAAVSAVAAVAAYGHESGPAPERGYITPEPVERVVQFPAVDAMLDYVAGDGPGFTPAEVAVIKQSLGEGPVSLNEAIYVNDPDGQDGWIGYGGRPFPG